MYVCSLSRRSNEIGSPFCWYIGEIITKQMLDREERRMYEILVMASDAGGRSCLTTVRITLIDLNDNAPQFQLDEYKASIPSGMDTNFSFLKVKGAIGIRDLERCANC